VSDSVDTTPLDILSAAAEVPRPQDVLDGVEAFLAGDLRPEARVRLEELRTRIVTRLHKASRRNGSWSRRRRRLRFSLPPPQAVV
jgi:hypothetical protein